MSVPPYSLILGKEASLVPCALSIHPCLKEGTRVKEGSCMSGRGLYIQHLCPEVV